MTNCFYLRKKIHWEKRPRKRSLEKNLPLQVNFKQIKAAAYLHKKSNNQ